MLGNVCVCGRREADPEVCDARRGRYGTATIVDEFGRDRVVSKRSTAYQECVTRVIENK